MNWFGNISIRYKISFISVICILGFIAFQVINYRLSVFTAEELNNIEKLDFPVLEISNRTYVHFLDMARMYEAAVAEGDIDTVEEAKVLADKISSDLIQIKVLKPEYEDAIDNLLDTFSYYSTSVHMNALNLVESDGAIDPLSDNAMFESMSHVRVLRERFDSEQRVFRTRLNGDFAEKLSKLQNQSKSTVSQGLILGIVLIFILFFASFSIIRQITSALDNAVSIAYQVANGKLSSPIESKYDDETGLLIHSLAIMRDSLKTQKEEDDLRQTNQRRVTELNETMRGDKTLEELGFGVLNYLASSLGATVGAFWVFEDDKKTLKRVSGYALSSEAQKRDTCLVGEGLVGEAAEQGRSYHSNDLPLGYLSIESSLGSSDSGSLLVVPFEHEGEISGVIELASFTRFEANDVAFINRYNTGIAIAVNSSQSRLKMSTILTKTQLQAQELEQQRVALENKSEQLELSGRYKSQFLSTMSHELRTPLNSILILSKGLIENKKNNLLPKQQEHAKVIHAAGSDLLALINDILDLSKVEEGKLSLIIDEIDTSEFSRIIYHQFEYEAEEKGIEFEVTVSEELPQYFYTDIHRLRQILRNFLSNAFKFTEKGFIRLNMDLTMLNTHPQSESEPAIAFRVTDSGIGISKEKHDHIFEAFQQADGTTSRQYGGTGLGLTISRELSELMRGYITVDSQGEGHGSVFTLTLPIDNRQAAEDFNSSSVVMPDRKSVKKAQQSIQQPILMATNTENQFQGLSQGPRRILLVEDDLLQVEAIQKIFADQDFMLDTANTTAEAQELLNSQSYDCLILDLYLPDGNSIELLRDQRRKEAQENNIPTHRLFTIVYTAETVTRDTESELQAIADRIIIKTQRSLEWLVNEINQFFMFEFSGSDSKNSDLTGSVAQNNVKVKAISHSTKFNEGNNTDDYDEAELDSFIENETSDTDSASEVLDDVVDNSKSLKGKGVLIVDDDIRNIYSLSAAFEDFDMNVHTAQSGEEALSFLREKIDEKQVDIILMDMMMPVMDGVEATKLIRKVPELSSIPIIALTAKTMPEDKLDFLSAGVDAHVAKPVDIPELERHILSFIG